MTFFPPCVVQRFQGIQWADEVALGWIWDAAGVLRMPSAGVGARSCPQLVPPCLCSLVLFRLFLLYSFWLCPTEGQFTTSISISSQVLAISLQS